MFSRGLVLRVLVQACARSLTRFSSNSGLSLAALLGAVLLIPTSGWANTTKNCPVEPAQGVPIVSGETYFGGNCVLNNAGDVDSFTFNASAGDTWSMVLGDGSTTTPSICLALIPPGSTTSTPLGCTFGTAVETVANIQKLVAGTYTILVTEQNTGTITYGLSLERLSPAPPDGIPLILNTNVAAQVTPPTAQNAYTLLGNTADTYKITLSDAGGVTCFAVYQPDGTLVVNGGCTFGTAVPVVSANVTPTHNGTHVVVVNTGGTDTINSYNLELACLAGPDNCKQPPPLPCALTDKLSYNAASGILTMNFTLATQVPVTWNAWLTSQSTVQSLWSVSQPATEPAASITKTQALVKSGKVGVLSTLTVSPGGITCSNLGIINTGTP
jgi:hypothetical protein